MLQYAFVALEGRRSVGPFNHGKEGEKRATGGVEEWMNWRG